MNRGIRWVLVALAAEKIVQHAFVTWAFMADVSDLRSQMAVDYRWLMVTGLVIDVLFAVALLGLIGQDRRSLYLLIVLAGADVVGEFVAQGTIAITITVSLVVAVAILLLGARALRRTRTSHPLGSVEPPRGLTTRRRS